MIQRRTSPSGIGYYASPLLEQIGIRHAFSTRIGGISPAPFDSLNLGNPSGCDYQDDDARIQTNYRRLQQAIRCGQSNRCWVHQVHGNIVEDAGRSDFENGTRADALVTTNPAHVLAVRVADCVPILIANAKGTAVAAIHAGWRGVVAGIIQCAISRLSEISPTDEPSDLTAAIGPCIGFDAFEVGSEVLAEFQRIFGKTAPIRFRPGGKGWVNLAESCRLQLKQSGLLPERIDFTDRCTFRDSHEFFSHRRDNGITGRMAALIAPRSE